MIRILLLLVCACLGYSVDMYAPLGAGPVPLTATDFKGVLAVANGGTNSSTPLSGSSIMVSNGTQIVQGAAGTSTQVLHGNASGAPTYSAVSLAADVTGTLPIANGGTNATTAAAARSSLGLAIFEDGGQIEAPTAKTYYVHPVTATFAGTYNSITIYTVSGTCTANFKIGSTSITGASAIAVTSTPQTVSVSAANAFAIGDTVTMVITAPVAAVDLVYNMSYTR